MFESKSCPPPTAWTRGWTSGGYNSGYMEGALDIAPSNFPDGLSGQHPYLSGMEGGIPFCFVIPSSEEITKQMQE